MAPTGGYTDAKYLSMALTGGYADAIWRHCTSLSPCESATHKISLPVTLKYVYESVWSATTHAGLSIRVGYVARSDGIEATAILPRRSRLSLTVQLATREVIRVVNSSNIHGWLPDHCNS